MESDSAVVDLQALQDELAQRRRESLLAEKR